MTPTPADNIAKQIMEAYHPQDAQDIQNAVKRIFAPIFEAARKGHIEPIKPLTELIAYIKENASMPKSGDFRQLFRSNIISINIEKDGSALMSIGIPSFATFVGDPGGT